MVEREGGGRERGSGKIYSLRVLSIRPPFPPTIFGSTLSTLPPSLSLSPPPLNSSLKLLPLLPQTGESEEEGTRRGKGDGVF
jgi:hypothetical protein